MKLNLINSLLLVGMALFALLTIVWGVDKGFDLTDAGFHMMNLVEPDHSPARFQYQWYIIKAFGWMDLGVLGYKYLRIALIAVSALFFAWAGQQWIKQQPFFKEDEKLPTYGFFGFILLGSLMGFSLQPTTLSYNNMTVIFLLLVGGGILRYLTLLQQTGTAWRRYLILGVLGWITIITFFTKFTSGAALFAGIGAMVFVSKFNRTQSWISTLPALIAFGVGLGFGLLIHQFFIASIPEWSQTLGQEVAVMRKYSIGDILYRHFYTFFLGLDRGLFSLIFVPIGLFFSLKAYNMLEEEERKPIHTKLLYGAFGITLLYLIGKAIQLELYQSGMFYNKFAFDIFMIVLVAMFALLLPFVNIAQLKKMAGSIEQREVILMTAFLLVLPFFGAFGTRNHLPLQFLQYLFAWFLVFIIGYYIIKRELKYIGGILLGIAAVFGLSQIISGYVFHPQRLNGSLFDQHAKIGNLDRAKDVKFEPSTKQFVTRINKIIKSKTKFKSGDPMISFYYPGLTYLLEGVSPSSSWFKMGNFYDLINCYRLDASDLEKMDRTVIIKPTDQVFSDRFEECMRNNGLKYPDAYVPLGKVAYKETFYMGKEKEYEVIVPIKLLKTQSKSELNQIAEDFLEEGRSYRGIGDFEASIESFKRASNIKEKYVDAQFLMCDSYIQMEQYDRAINACRKAVVWDPDHERAKKRIKMSQAAKKK